MQHKIRLNFKMPRGVAQPPEERVWNFINKIGRDNETLPEYQHLTRCWAWKGYKNIKGYGQLSVDGKIMPAHRFSYQLHHPLTTHVNDTKMCVCHRCDNTECCNPEHLRLGTQTENMRDMYEKGRGNQPKGEKQHLSKLTEKHVLEIRAKYSNEKITKQKLADEYGVGHTLIGFIINRKNWKHI